ncbi:MAG: heme ABC exporter ATP-binding protein CcmA [Hyphomicrobiales bacterium]
MELIAHTLACVRGSRTIFRGVSFALGAGTLTELRGPNGAGKTSLLRTIAGLIEPEAGTLDLKGGDPELSVGQQCHLIAHQDAVKPHLTVRENLAFWRDFLGGGDVDQALATFAISPLASFQAALLSAGQKRRLALSRLALVHRPVWLLDEPTVGLDAASRDRLNALVARHLEAGGIVLAATHIDLGIRTGVLEMAPQSGSAA